MAWKEIKKKANDLKNSVEFSNNEFEGHWEEFKIVCQDQSKIGSLVTFQLEEQLKKSPLRKDQIRVLDHGCGGGLKSLYLMALGYTNVYGVNLNADVEFLNAIAKRIGLTDIPRFLKIDGSNLPFASDTFDFIFSLQVLEHVTDKDIRSFYAEESRVAVHGAIIYHELPHLLQPYDSHSRLFLAHWFPSFLQPFVYGLLKTIQTAQNCFHHGHHYARKFNGDFLSLRMPSFHFKMARRYYGNFVDISEERLSAKLSLADYDSDGLPNVRRLLSKMFSLPIVGGLIIKMLKFCFMVSTYSINQKITKP